MQCLDKINIHHILEPKCEEKGTTKIKLLKRDGGSYEDNPILKDTWCRVISSLCNYLICNIYAYILWLLALQASYFVL